MSEILRGIYKLFTRDTESELTSDVVNGLQQREIGYNRGRSEFIYRDTDDTYKKLGIVFHYDSRSFTSFANAISTIGSENCTLIVSRQEAVNSNLTTPENIHLFLTGAGSFDVGTGFTLTINGQITAPHRKIFYGNGTTVLGAIASSAYPQQWWEGDRDSFIQIGQKKASNARYYSLGIDESDSQKFKISYGASGAAPGTNDYLSIDTAGAVHVYNGLTVAGTLGVTGAVSLSSSLTFAAGQDIIIADNHASALTISEGGNAYLRFITTNGSESIQAFKAVTMSSTLGVTGLITATAGVNAIGGIQVPDGGGITSDFSGTGRTLISRSGTTLNIGVNGSWTSAAYNIASGTHTFNIGGATVLEMTSGQFNVAQPVNMASTLGVTGAVSITGASSSVAANQFSVIAADADSAFRLGNNTSNSIDMSYTRSDGASVFSINGHSMEAAFGGTLAVTGIQTNANDLVFSASTGIIRSNTVDGTDNKRIVITGGGANGTDRGGSIYAFGNEMSSDGGTIFLEAGNISTGKVSIWTGGLERFAIANNGTANFTGLITATGGIEIAGGASAAGRINRSATSGLVIRGVTGSSYDMVLTNPGGSDIMYNPTGSIGVQFLGGITATGGLSVPDGQGVTTEISASTRDLVARSGTTLLIGENGGWTQANYRIASGAHEFMIGATTRFMVVAGGAEVDGGLVISGTGSYATGKLYFGSTDGIVIAGRTGSSYDLSLVNAAGSTSLLRNPTGTNNLEIPNALSIGTTLLVAGVLTNNQLTGTGTRVVTATAAGALGSGSSPTIVGTNTWTDAQTFTSAPVFNSVTASEFLLVNGSKVLTSVGSTGSGNVVRATSPTLVTPFLGVASATSISLGGGEAFTYNEGSFTCELTGFTTTVSGTCTYTRIGRIVTLLIPHLSGTSNASTMVLTGVPAEIIPSSIAFQYFPVKCTDNGVQLANPGLMLVENDGTFSVYQDYSPLSWTTSGTKGLWPSTLTYHL